MVLSLQFLSRLHNSILEMQSHAKLVLLHASKAPVLNFKCSKLLNNHTHK